jgi:hypothetical protein
VIGNTVLEPSASMIRGPAAPSSDGLPPHAMKEKHAAATIPVKEKYRTVAFMLFSVPACGFPSVSSS